MKNFEKLCPYLLSPHNGESSISVRDKNTLTCTGTGQIYPIFKDIVWAYQDPEASIFQWQQRYNLLLADIQQEIETLKFEKNLPEIMETTKKRLQKIIQAKVENKKEIRKILTPFDLISSKSTAYYYAMQYELPESYSLMGYSQNIYRDWAWETDENKVGTDLVSQVIGEEHLGKSAVFGAGSCRLAVDLFQLFQPEMMICLDINPFLLSIAERMIRGQSVTLHEFPIAPKDLDSTAVRQRLKNTATQNSNNLFLVLGDALGNLLKKESLDTIITPWFVDIAQLDLRQTLLKINSILKPQGRWINFGSLTFAHKSYSRCYSPEELKQILAETGFHMQTIKDEKIPYLNSPYSRHSRTEQVLCFAAVKQESQKPNIDTHFLPPWILDPHKTIPKTKELQNMLAINSIFNSIVSKIDGKISLKNLAIKCTSILETQPKNAEKILTHMLTSLYQKHQITNRF